MNLTEGITKTISEIIKDSSTCPLPLHIILNNMGINLCNVESVAWAKLEDGQVLNITINFIPTIRTIDFTVIIE